MGGAYLSWLKSLSREIQSRISHRPALLKILSNVSWLLGDKVIRIGVGLFVGVWVARYLGPQQFGVLSYSMTFVALFAPIATLGLREIVIRDLVRQPEAASVTLGTTFFLQVLGGLCMLGFVVVATVYDRPGDSQIPYLVIILAASQVCRSNEFIKYWFESQVESKYVALVESCTFLTTAAVKIGLILNEASLISFAWVVLFETVLLALGLFVTYARQGERVRGLSVRVRRMRSLCRDSWPLLLSGVSVMIYMRIDQIMLGHMLGDEAVGIYAAAVSLSEAWYFIPMIVASSVYPSLLKMKASSEEKYLERVQTLYDAFAVLSVFVALVTTVVAKWVVIVLYGEAYMAAGQILMLQIWAGIFVAMGVARGKWLLAENLHNVGLWCIGIALVVNVVGNFFLIPVYGIVGATLATVVAQATTALFAPALFKSTRSSVTMLIRSLNPLRWVALKDSIR